jgi:hypothetical protein
MSQSRRPFRRQLCLACVALAVIAVGWIFTATWGVRDVTAYFDDAASGLDGPDRHVQRLYLDPDIRPYPAKRQMPWYFVGNASSPCPFVVAIDAAYQVALLAGQRTRYYVFWFSGIKVPIYDQTAWVS